MTRLVAALVLCCTGAVLLPGGASAHSLVRSGGGLVSYISADATSLNGLAVRPSGNRVEFRDDRVDGGMDPGSCTPGDVDARGFIVQTFCALSGVQRVRIDLGDREDTATVTVGVPVTLLGGPGADRIAGGAGGDEVSGGEGNDAVGGGPGNDVVSGGEGGDSLAGNAGADRIAARDGLTDTVVCGPGADSVDADTFDSVAADCERVARVVTQAPPLDVEDGRPPAVDVGAPTLQVLGRSRMVRVYATSSEPGALSASGSLTARGLTLPVKRIGRKRVRVPGAGAALSYRLTGRHWRLASRALRRGRRVVLRLGVVATDASGRSTRRDAPPILLAGRPRAIARAAHPEPGDVDGDEIRDEVDNCPTVKNGGQVNTDRLLAGGDGAGDACDDDDDADGVVDTTDNCRVVQNPGQEDMDRDGYGDACPPVDSDADGVLDIDDNCDNTPNLGLADLDGDDRGDACDPDVDGDRIDDPFDNCPTVYNLDRGVDRNGDGFVNQRDQIDRDGDGVGTACDPDELFVDAPPPPPPRPPASSDSRAPRLTARIARRQRMAAVKAGLVVRLRCSEACDATAELSLNRRRARRLGLRRVRIVASGSARLGGAGTTYAFVRFTRPARRRIFGRRAIRTTLTTVAVDDAGNRRTLRRRIELRR